MTERSGVWEMKQIIDWRDYIAYRDSNSYVNWLIHFMWDRPEWDDAVRIIRELGKTPMYTVYRHYDEGNVVTLRCQITDGTIAPDPEWNGLPPAPAPKHLTTHWMPHER